MIASVTHIYMHLVSSFKSLITYTLQIITKPSDDQKNVIQKRSNIHIVMNSDFFFKSKFVYLFVGQCWKAPTNCVLGCGYGVWSRHHPWHHGAGHLARETGLKVIDTQIVTCL